MLLQHPAVTEAAVIPKPDPVLGERVHAVVFSAAGRATGKPSLQAFCAERLADYKVPESFTILDRPAAAKLQRQDRQARARATRCSPPS